MKARSRQLKAEVLQLSTFGGGRILTSRGSARIGRVVTDYVERAISSMLMMAIHDEQLS